MSEKWFSFGIGLNVWTVGFTEDLENEGKPCWGICDAENCFIALTTDLKADPIKLRATLIHEMLHAVSEYTQMDSKMNEKAIRRLEGPLSQVLSSIISLPALPGEHSLRPLAPIPPTDAHTEEFDTGAHQQRPDIGSTGPQVPPQNHTHSDAILQFEEESAHKGVIAPEFREFWHNSQSEE